MSKRSGTGGGAGPRRNAARRRALAKGTQVLRREPTLLMVQGRVQMVNTLIEVFWV